MMIQLAKPNEAPALVEPILRSIPDWFGIEAATRAYIEAAGIMPTWIAHGATTGTANGFVTVRRHYPHAAEVHCMAVHRDHHGRGIGTALIHAVERSLHREGVRFLQVKTMGPSRPNREYAMTLRFYKSVGFAEVEEFIGLWNGLPALQLIKSLSSDP